MSSYSSCFDLLLRFELFRCGGAGRELFSFALGAPSDVGDPTGDLLLDVEGADRRERRRSFGDGGGPIALTLVITDRLGV